MFLFEFVGEASAVFLLLWAEHVEVVGFDSRAGEEMLSYELQTSL